MELATKIQILDKSGCVSLYTNTLVKWYEQIVIYTEIFSFDKTTSLRWGKLWI